MAGLVYISGMLFNYFIISFYRRGIDEAFEEQGFPEEVRKTSLFLACVISWGLLLLIIREALKEKK